MNKDSQKLLMTLAIIIILLISIPSFLKFIMRSKTVEALTNLNKLFNSSVSSFDTEHNVLNNTSKQQPIAPDVNRTAIPRSG